MWSVARTTPKSCGSYRPIELAQQVGCGGPRHPKPARMVCSSLPSDASRRVLPPGSEGHPLDAGPPGRLLCLLGEVVCALRFLLGGLQPPHHKAHRSLSLTPLAPLPQCSHHVGHVEARGGRMPPVSPLLGMVGPHPEKPYVANVVIAVEIGLLALREVEVDLVGDSRT